MSAPLVGWFPAVTSTHDAVRSLLGPAAVVRHRCPGCGAGDHGRPVAVLDGREHAVSASRAGGHLVVVARPAGTDAVAPLGVDVERAAAPPPPGELVLHPDEEGADPLTTWLAKEAILKQLGVGLIRPMPTIRVRDFTVVPLDAPAGLVARLACGGPGTRGQAGSAGSWV